MKTSDISSHWLLISIKELGGWDAWDMLRVYGYPEKVINSAYERENRAGRIDYGVSLRTAWISQKGERFLRAQL